MPIKNFKLKNRGQGNGFDDTSSQKWSILSFFTTIFKYDGGSKKYDNYVIINHMDVFKINKFLCH